MVDDLDALIRKGKSLEMQLGQLTAELSALREQIAQRMGAQREYYGHGVVAKKWARVRWEVNTALLLDELPREALDYFKDVVFTKEKLDRAVQAGHLPPRLYDRAVKRSQEGWNVSLKILDAQAPEPDWDTAEG
jgi:hypothetical protein